MKATTHTGTITVGGKDYTLKTQYPLGKRRANYWIASVIDADGDETAFASDEALAKWMQQQELAASWRKVMRALAAAR
jgi:hypothetical protein